MKLKICKICKREILPKDNYVRLTDYLAGNLYEEGFYHTLCYTNQIKGNNPAQQEMKKAAQTMLSKAERLLNRVQGKPEEVYEVQ